MANKLITINGVPTLQVTEPNELGKYKLIDVRRPEEFTGELGHIPGSKLVTLGPELDDYLREENPNTKILFICRSSARSGNATLQAQAKGFTDVYNMDGGMLYWNDQKFPTNK